MKVKQKTHKATAKRVKVTKGGKLLRGRVGSRHLRSHKSAKEKRKSALLEEISAVDRKRVSKLIGGDR